MHRHNGLDYPLYVPPSEHKLLERHRNVERAFLKAFSALGKAPDDYQFDCHSIDEALVRTDQRALHYLMYHDMRINELKSMAIFTYWMLRLKPITRIAGGLPDINEQIALQMILETIRRHRIKKDMPEHPKGGRMKRPPPVIWILGIAVVVKIALIIAVVLFLNSRFNIFTLTLPRAENVTRITMQLSYFDPETQRRGRKEPITIDSPDEISTVISALAGARRAGLDFAANETPMGQGLSDWLAVYIYVPCDQSWSGGEAMSHRLYLYARGGNEYIWHGYVGVFRINASNRAVLDGVAADSF